MNKAVRKNVAPKKKKKKSIKRYKKKHQSRKIRNTDFKI